MCGNLLLPRASPPCSHLRGTDFGSAVARGRTPHHSHGGERVVAPSRLGMTVWLAMVSSEPAIPLRIRALQLQRSIVTGWWQRCAHLPLQEDVFQWLVAEHRRRVVCWRPCAMPPAAVLHYSVVNKLHLKRFARNPCRRGDSSCLGASRLTPLVVNIQHTLYECQMCCLN